MIGLARRQELWASDFLKYAEIIAPLSRDELIVIGRLMAEDAKLATPPPPGSTELWQTIKTLELFPNEQYLAAVAARAQRSGLINPITGFDGTHYELSPMPPSSCCRAVFAPDPALVHGAEMAESRGRTSGCIARRGPRLPRRNCATTF
jgi:hypothetical protein